MAEELTSFISPDEPSTISPPTQGDLAQERLNQQKKEQRARRRHKLRVKFEEESRIIAQQCTKNFQDRYGIIVEENNAIPMLSKATVDKAAFDKDALINRAVSNFAIIKKNLLFYTSVKLK